MIRGCRIGRESFVPTLGVLVSLLSLLVSLVVPDRASGTIPQARPE